MKKLREGQCLHASIISETNMAFGDVVQRAQLTPLPSDLWFRPRGCLHYSLCIRSLRASGFPDAASPLGAGGPVQTVSCCARWPKRYRCVLHSPFQKNT